MAYYRFLTVAALAGVLWGCGSVGGGSPGVQLTAARGLYVAEAAFDGTLLASEAAVKSGALKAGSPQALKVRSQLDQAHTALVAARAAYALGDLVATALQVQNATNTLADAKAAVPASPH